MDLRPCGKHPVVGPQSQNSDNQQWILVTGLAYATDSNRLASTTVNNTTQTYSHNAHGSFTSMPHLDAMEWTADEHLHKITRSTSQTWYTYDSTGQRVRKYTEKGGITEERLYLGGFEIYRKRQGTTVTLERETLHLMDGNRRIALVETKPVDNTTTLPLPSTVTRYQLDNHLQSATLELDDKAQVISYEEYYPYGDTSYRSSKSVAEVSEKRYRYTGKEKDEESGLYYHGARYYAAWLGRWTAADPAGMVDGACLYAYVRNHPTGLVDPDGRAGEKPFGAYLPGTTAGEEALQFYANLAVEGERQGGIQGGLKQVAGWSGGLLSALWTPETATTTAVTLGTAGLGSLAGAGRLGAASLPTLKGLTLWGSYESAASVTEAVSGERSGAHLSDLGDLAWSGNSTAGQKMSTNERVISGGVGLLGLGLSAYGANGLSKGIPKPQNSNQAKAASVHPGRSSAQSSQITKESILRSLRQAGTKESLATAKLISRGKLDMKLLPRDPSNKGLGGLYRFGAKEIELYLNSMKSPIEAAGVATHEGLHFAQKLTPQTYNLGHEFDAFVAQQKVDPSHWTRAYNDQELMSLLSKHPVY